MVAARSPRNGMVRSNVVSRPKSPQESQPFLSFVFRAAAVADEVPVWSPFPHARDRVLRAFWRTEKMMATALTSTVMRYAAMEWSITGPPLTREVAHDFLNLGAESGYGFSHLISKTWLDQFCLGSRTTISLGGERLGKTKSIREIVRDKDTGPVLSLDTHGHVVEREITEWHRSPLGDRSWWWLSTEFGGHARSERGGIFLTEDHPMRTSLGWRQARDITPGMRIATSDPVPSRGQSELLVGTLLGDASLAMTHNRAAVRFNHCEAQRDWLDFKMESLRGFQWTGYKEYAPRKGGLSSGRSVSVNSRGTLGLRDWHSSWYPDGEKHVNRLAVETYFSPRMLAVWYCDDGSIQRHRSKNGNPTRPGARFYTDGFSVEDSEWLAALLSGHGIEAKTATYFYKRRSKFYTHIQLGADAAEELFRRIGPFVPPSMRYKLGEDAPSFDPSSAELEPSQVYYDRVVDCRQRDRMVGAPHGSKKVDPWTYHIGVADTRNFVASGLISHNTQDNGGFWEIIRSEPTTPDAPTIGLKHLDSARCRRTGVYDQPVVYWDEKNQPHVLQWYEVCDFVDLPASEEIAYGASASCAVSRILEDARYMRDVAIYQHEKVSGRNPRAVHFVGGVSGRSLRKALEDHKLLSENKGAMYIDPPIIPGNDPTATVSKVTLEMASLYDGFDEDKAKRWFYVALSNAIGVDYQEFAPMPAGNLGTSQQSNTLSMKGNTKGPALFQAAISHAMNYRGILPRGVEFNYYERDPVFEAAQLDLRIKRGQDRIRRMGTSLAPGELTAAMARQMAVRDGDLPVEYLALADPPETLLAPQLLSTGPGGG